MTESTRVPSRHEPALAPLALSDDDVDPGRRAALRQRPQRFPWVPAFVLIAIAAGAAVVWRMQTPAPPRAPTAEAPPAQAPAADAPPAVRYPIGALPAAADLPESAAAPPVASDDALLAALLALPGAAALDRLLVTDNLVHRFVATVDNLPRGSVAAKVMTVRPAEGAFAIDTVDGRSTIGRANAPRYAPYLRAMQSVDTAALVALYVRNYAIFQQAYRDLGYPNGYFNDRLVDVIDHLLAAPEPPAPVTVLQPRVLYEYANPDLEARSAGQKAMMRLGVESERAAKAKLREIRKALTAANQAR